MKRDDLLPVAQGTATQNGAPVNLTGATNPRFLMRLMNAADQSTPKVDGVATIVTPSAGTLQYDWSGSDTDTGGIYAAEFEVTIGGKPRTFRLPNLVIEANIWTEPASGLTDRLWDDTTGRLWDDATTRQWAA